MFVGTQFGKVCILLDYSENTYPCKSKPIVLFSNNVDCLFCTFQAIVSTMQRSATALILRTLNQIKQKRMFAYHIHTYSYTIRAYTFCTSIVQHGACLPLNMTRVFFRACVLLIGENADWCHRVRSLSGFGLIGPSTRVRGSNCAPLYMLYNAPASLTHDASYIYLYKYVQSF